MGNGSLSISLAVGIAMLTTVGQACAQTAAQGRAPDQASAPPAIGQPGAAAAPATPPAPEKSRRAAPKAAEPSSVDAYIVNRPPVRREVPPQSRPVQARPAAPSQTPTAQAPSAAAAGGVAAAASANSSTAADASAASAGRNRMWPVVVAPQPEANAQSAASAAQGPMWSEAEIKEARAHCTALLKGVDVAMTPEDPIKQGECGSPVLFRVTSIGKGPAVEVSPPVLLTCDMIASLDKWMKREVQPQARANLGGAIVRLETMSSYSCRNAYGRAKARLSEHGKANAIDISGFSTAKDTTTVLAGWGPTQREQRAIAQRLDAERAVQPQASGSPPLPSTAPSSQTPSSQMSASPAPEKGKAAPQGGSSRVTAAPPVGAGGAAPAPVPNIPGVIISSPSAVHGANSPFGFGPARLGGPKAPEQPPKPVPGDAASKQKFLRDIHASACKYFGTVLGPEANNAHRNHFHLDMAQRNRGNFCE